MQRVMGIQCAPGRAVLLLLPIRCSVVSSSWEQSVTRDDKGSLLWRAAMLMKRSLNSLRFLWFLSFSPFFFFFPCGFLLSSTEQTRTFPCRSSLRRTRTLLNYLTYSPYSKESSRSFPRSPGSITLGHRQSKPLS